jgi:hypothetical protein
MSAVPRPRTGITLALRGGAGVIDAARMSANSMSPSSGGITWAHNAKYLAGIAWSLLSLCQS